MSGLSDAQVRAGWLPWNGGERPVPRGLYIQVRYRDGGLGEGAACNWEDCWRHSAEPGHDAGSEIVAYRVVEL